jgi:hypothetical protein
LSALGEAGRVGGGDPLFVAESSAKLLPFVVRGERADRVEMQLVGGRGGRAWGAAARCHSLGTAARGEDTSRAAGGKPSGELAGAARRGCQSCLAACVRPVVVVPGVRVRGRRVEGVLAGAFSTLGVGLHDAMKM